MNEDKILHAFPFYEIETALMKAIYISRWTENKEALYAVLTPEEAEQIVKDIFMELNKIGYEIRKTKK